MRVAIFSDVHGNLTALQAVLADIEEKHTVDTIVFAGDLCVFGPRPEACLELVRGYEDGIASLFGNTDAWIDGPPLLSDDIAEEERERWRQVHDAVSWTRERLPEMDRAWLRELPFHRRISPSVNPRHDLFVVHANPKDVNQVIYPPADRQKELYDEVRQTDRDLEALFDDIVTDVVAFGHIHVPFIRPWRDLTLVNVSSVSLPADGDPRAKYAVLTWNDDEWHVAHYYVEYDVEPEIVAYRENRPPGWEKAVERLERDGILPQGG